MRVAFFDYSLFYESLGLANLMGALKAENHKYKLFIISEEKDLLKSVREFKPDLLGFTTITGTHYISFQIARYLKKHMDIPVLFGGSHVTLFPEKSIEANDVDMICRGEGEEVLIELLDTMMSGKDYSNIKNLWVKRNGEVIKNDMRPLIHDLDSLPFPDKSEYLKYPIIRDFPLKRFISGYGCPYTCSFCHNTIFLKDTYKGKGSYLRKKSVRRFLQEIKEVQKVSRMERIHLHDDNFNYSKRWLKEFCERYPKEIGIPWSCTVTVNLLPEDTVKMMHKAGCVGVTYGLETHNEHVRVKILNKTALRNKHFDSACKLLNKYNIKHAASAMLNLPGENFIDAFKTLHYARMLNTYLVRAAVYSVIEKQPINSWLKENNYIKKAHEIENYKTSKLEDLAIKSPDMVRLMRLSPFINILLKFPFLEPLIKILTYFPIGEFGRSRLYDGFLEMKFMDIPLWQGIRYYLRINKGLKAYQNLR